MGANNNCKYYGLPLTYFAIFAHCTSTEKPPAIKKKDQNNSKWLVYPRYPFLSLWAHKECYFCPLLSVSEFSSSIFQGLTPLSFRTPEIVALVLPWVLQIPASNVLSQYQKLFGVECCKRVSNDRGLHWHGFTDAKVLLRWFWNKEHTERKTERRLSLTTSHLKICPCCFHCNQLRHTL